MKRSAIPPSARPMMPRFSPSPRRRAAGPGGQPAPGVRPALPPGVAGTGETVFPRSIRGHATPHSWPRMETGTARRRSCSGNRSPPQARSRPPPQASPDPAAKPEELVRQAINEERGLERARTSSAEPRSRDPPEPAVPDSEASIDWKLPALAAGAVILALAGGAWAGLEVGNDNQQVQPDRIATLRVPPATASSGNRGPAARRPGVIAEAQPTSGLVPALAPAERTRPPLEIDLPEGNRPRELDQAQPDARSHRTGRRGSVGRRSAGGKASASRHSHRPHDPSHRLWLRAGRFHDGDRRRSGAFKVTCTSGQSYRAAPVRGRYHFRRISGR